GAGLYNGALSSKTFWEISKDVAAARRRLQRYSDIDLKVDFTDILNDVNDAIFFRKIQLETHLLLLQRKRPGLLSFKSGEAKLISPNEVRIEGADGGEPIKAGHIILATGSRPRYLPSIPIDEKIIVTSDGIETFREFPESMVILGAGVI